MSRIICVVNEFITDAHRRQIDAAAEKHGFSVRYYQTKADASGHLADCEVLFGHWRSLLKEAPMLKWYCCSYAGVDPYQPPFRFPEGVLLTNSSGAYGVTISEHIMMVTLMLQRRMLDYAQIVRDRGWTNDLPVRSIQGSRLTLLGTGDIGTTFAQRAKALCPASVTGVNRSGRVPDPVYDRVMPMAELDRVLPETDILVMSLPSTPETVGILSRERLALLPESAILVNVGRGSAIDQDALMDALNAGRLAGAALDVMTPEPLPADHPLWTTKNLLITPHVAGNMTLGYTCNKTVSMFCDDLENYAEGRPLKHLVDLKRGY
ncbi:D-2-hydroxyacid dehydrogenase [uncultured Oscillibacter sp.]|uniref:D-2-hydroxyacid dehydrogenase n=1 Tax=uncultured Oscillibacter sp. TaxID=876091 RepID=UPI0025F755CB|nr:D-2-hydroxyacid dehydrogenase [uncultured Oscillibacter sp.]